MKEYSPEDFKKAEHIDKQELKSYMHHCTVGMLKEFIKEHDIKDDAILVVQRVFDWYYEKGGWKTYPKTQDIGNVEYTPAWCPVFYKEDEDILFIDLHY